MRAARESAPSASARGPSSGALRVTARELTARAPTISSGSKICLGAFRISTFVIDTTAVHSYCLVVGCWRGVLDGSERASTDLQKERIMPLTATGEPGHHHFASDIYMDDGHRHVRCGISRLALEVLQPELPPTKEGRMQAFQPHRRRIERAASAKFDRGQLEPDGSTVLVRAADLV